jgi:glycerol kinase
MLQALSEAGLAFSDVDSIALTNQRETVLVWDKVTGKPAYNAIVWQDGRAASYSSFSKEDHSYLRECTGLELVRSSPRLK